ncbi:MAG: hypothetical protein HFJ28_00260 [Clostridia bacterium]|nr:hypothetical protein [Clostridia bacterium]
MEKSVETIGTKLKAKFKSERGEIGDSLIIVVGLLIGAVLMFMFPLMSSSERTDDISQMAITTATEDFINKIRTTGKITLDEYEQYLQTITATGNTFDVDMTVYQLDENPGVKVTQAEMTKIGENVYYTIYTSQIEEKLNQSGRMKLKEGDRVTVTVKNTNQTIAQQLRNFFYQMLGNESYQIAAQKSAIVTVNGSN